MNGDPFSRRRAKRFAQLLDEANGGPRHHVRSRADDQLAALVAVSRQLGADPPPVHIDTGFRTDLRAVLVATAEREGIGDTSSASTDSAPLGHRGPVATGPRGPFLPAATARRARARGAILVGIAAGAIAVSGISTASENAVPGDALYGMKRHTERAQLALTNSDISRGQLFLNFARIRVDEAATLRGDRLGFAAVLDDMDSDTRRGVRLLTTAATQHADPAGLDAVNTFVVEQRRAVDALLDGATRAERDRVRRSTALLDAIRKRSDALRAAGACGPPASTGTDTLGPIPRACPGNR
ncbi:DUF5667 domain-containing protein [Micromonospora sp. DT233]|uniref:DUF5667 domain-containing protein n=1 Tax=Micromonospora sp. DT233 TaxID=3393432 RepID=UPI003CF0DBE0